MEKGYLSQYFKGVGTKRLAAVDTLHHESTQHEVGDQDHGNVLKKILSKEERRIKNGTGYHTVYIWIGDEQETIVIDGKSSWYDTRRSRKVNKNTGKARTPEWRLYYQTNEITKTMSVNDRLFVAKLHDDSLLFIICEDKSRISHQLVWLFDLQIQNELEFTAKRFGPESDIQTDFVSRRILDEIGVEFEDPSSNDIEAVIGRFKLKFPSTAVFSKLARDTLPLVDARDDPDQALSYWLDQEDLMFRALEKKILKKRLKEGFITDGELDTEKFLKFSKSVHQTRYSRMGQSLEHHLEASFSAFKLKYSRKNRTENNSKPDFLFPGNTEYWDKSFQTDKLVMMGSKSSCKDRWRQVLAEAKKIERKHLFTLEPSISENQTNEMKANNLQLILPQGIHSSYSPSQQSWLMNLSEFIKFVQKTQA